MYCTIYMYTIVLKVVEVFQYDKSSQSPCNWVAANKQIIRCALHHSDWHHGPCRNGQISHFIIFNSVIYYRYLYRAANLCSVFTYSILHYEIKKHWYKWLFSF